MDHFTKDLETRAEERRFAKSVSLEELDLMPYIDFYVGKFIQEKGSRSQEYIDVIVIEIHDRFTRNGHSSKFDEDKCRLIQEYAGYLNRNSVSNEQKECLESYNVPFVEGKPATNTMAGVLWTSFPDTNNSLAWKYEERLMEKIESAICDKISRWMNGEPIECSLH
tara:strand:- start:8918 stop:9415 length:498 start_codon:yes stop_codon:yes gene_type:complete